RSDRLSWRDRSNCGCYDRLRVSQFGDRGVEVLDDLRDHVVGLDRLRDPVVVDDEIAEACQHEPDVRQYRELWHEYLIAALPCDGDGQETMQECRQKQPERDLHRSIAQEMWHQAWP